MTSNALKPDFAAGLADDVYLISREPTIEKAIESLQGRYGDVFTFGTQNLMKGMTGGPAFIKCRTAFGFVLIGKGPLDRQAFVIFRGTQYLADHLTNLNATVSRSAYGQPVHDGFGQALRSMKPQLQKFVPQLAGKTVHCIGHSLGGALATVCAEWLVSACRIKPYLYTFGSPRVGLFGFADICTKRIGGEKMFRVYHKTDLVPCMPIWPFIHTPNSGEDYRIPSPGIVPGITYHEMVKYISSVGDQTWSTLGSLRGEVKTEAGIEAWLKETKPVFMTLTTLEWLNQALMYVLEKCMAGVARVISQSCSTTFTLMDSLACILKKGVNLAESVSQWVVYLMRKIMVLLGHAPTVAAADLSHQFIRALLLELQQRVNIHVKQALSHVLVKGRAI